MQMWMSALRIRIVILMLLVRTLMGPLLAPVNKAILAMEQTAQVQIQEFHSVSLNSVVDMHMLIDQG